MEEDIILKCQKCNSFFYFTKEDQRFYKKKHFNIPKICSSCRKRYVKQEPKRMCYNCCYYKIQRTVVAGIETFCMPYCGLGGKMSAIVKDPCENWKYDPRKR
jgi:ribosomal protein L33